VRVLMKGQREKKENFVVLLKDETVQSNNELLKAVNDIKRLISDMNPPKVFIFLEKGYRMGKLNELLNILIPLRDLISSNEPNKLFIGIDNEALPIDYVMEDVKLSNSL
jgi:hypothetical protein